MEPKSGVYHRLGSPGGPGCTVAPLPVQAKGPDGSLIPATLLDVGTTATEVELLRTIAEAIGIRWGQDELGWWAVVPGTCLEVAPGEDSGDG